VLVEGVAALRLPSYFPVSSSSNPTKTSLHRSPSSSMSSVCIRSWKREQALCLLKRPRSECEEHLQEAAEDWQEECQRLQEDRQRLQEDCCQRLQEDCCQRLQEDEKLQQDEDKGPRQEEDAAKKDRLMVQSAGGRRDQLISDVSNSVLTKMRNFFSLLNIVNSYWMVAPNRQLSVVHCS
jgi:hypothetical protein